MDTITKAFHEIISNCFRCMKVYNTNGPKEAIRALESTKQGINSLIQHLRHIETKGGNEGGKEKE